MACGITRARKGHFIMRITKVLPFIALALALSACQTLTPEQQRAADEAKCSGYGFRHGTTPFANCLMNLELDRRADARAFLYSSDDDFWGPSFIVGGPYYHGGYRHHHRH
jgi:hypothetical protein